MLGGLEMRCSTDVGGPSLLSGKFQTWRPEGRTHRHAAAAQCGQTTGYASAPQSVVDTFYSPGMEPGTSHTIVNTVALCPFHFLF